MSANPADPGKPVGIPLPLRPLDDWSALKNRKIDVIIDGRLTDRGWVDDVMDDGSVLWLKNDGASGRRIIENLPGTVIRLSSTI